MCTCGLGLLTCIISVPAEFTIAQWPTYSIEAEAARNAIVDTHVARPLPAYDVRGNLIPPSRYPEELRRATVLLGFTMTHYDITKRRTNNSFATKCTICLDVQYIRVLIPPTHYTPNKRNNVHLNDPMSNAAKKQRAE